MLKQDIKAVETRERANIVTFYKKDGKGRRFFPIASFIRGFLGTTGNGTLTLILEWPGILITIYGNEAALERIHGLIDDHALSAVREHEEKPSAFGENYGPLCTVSGIFIEELAKAKEGAKP